MKERTEILPTKVLVGITQIFDEDTSPTEKTIELEVIRVRITPPSSLSRRPVGVVLEMRSPEGEIVKMRDPDLRRVGKLLAPLLERMVASD